MMRVERMKCVLVDMGKTSLLGVGVDILTHSGLTDNSQSKENTNGFFPGFVSFWTDIP